MRRFVPFVVASAFIAMVANGSEPPKAAKSTQCTLVMADLGAVTEEEVAAAFRPESIVRSPGQLRVPGVAIFSFRTERGSQSREVFLASAGAVVLPSKGKLALVFRGKESSAKNLYSAMSATGRTDNLVLSGADALAGIEKPIECQRTVNNNVEKVENILCTFRGVELVDFVVGPCP